MPIALSCDCGRVLRVKDDLAGKRIHCPQCKSILVVPGNEIEEDELEVVPDEDDDERIDDGTSRSAVSAKPPRKKRRKPRRDLEGRAPRIAFEPGWFGSVDSGVVGGLLMILIAVAWLVGGLIFGRLFIYPLFLAVIGIIAIIKGSLG